MNVRYRWPTEPARQLRLAPRLESWDAAGHRSQVNLREYLAEIATLADEQVGADDEHLAVALTVGLQPGVSLVDGGRDLDNYLLPIARTVGSHRLDAAFACKRPGTASSIVVTPSAPAAVDAPANLTVRTTGSYELRAWKEHIRTACADRVRRDGGVRAGPLGLDIAFGASSKRSWSTLWKPTVDSLGPLLGEEDPRRSFNPRDDRVVRLGLHRRIDDTLGWAVEIDVWWHDPS